jgi:hypothetical protein
MLTQVVIYDIHHLQAPAARRRGRAARRSAPLPHR